ncbi:unnamed protein product [Penicillium nalgiovense]|uniref:OPT family small oligopeptide transporter n=1 Tax=Penicillium nalgiovense TaxID=60175 RepID=A0A9W4MS48_PENNA|nr:unnamed protein product [Penicillium nalgiovense]CAG7952176.1 unnamed protein product [Penicillium nalgiovense]CAG7959176.1 unnamed protein product [Penicillium nalgiovense]CAG8018846.1 unnamed protein product [Penicillium nalgiovense]CAG8023429.1 unnamed protein product [Penicillium nalgiovense]
MRDMPPDMPESPTETSDISVVSQEAMGKKTPAAVLATKDEHTLGDDDLNTNPDTIIITGADAAAHLLPLRDDFDSVLTFRSILLASGLACFQAVMNQIYQFKPTLITIQGTFIVLISYFVGNTWAKFLPRGDKFEARWRAKGGQGNLPLWITVMKFLNNGPWSLKEHSICAITATAASNASSTSTVFAAQDLFYNLPLSATTVILSVISIGLFGYGICGIMRPISVWHTEAVYWASLPTVKTLQGLHWQEVKNSKPLRYFCVWLHRRPPVRLLPYSTMSLVEPPTIKLTSTQTSLPLKLQVHQAVGLFSCFIIMIGIYYGNGWNSRSLPFMSTRLLTNNGTAYPLSDVFPSGILDEVALAEHGLPRITGTFAFAMFMANAAMGALIVHCILFWGNDIRQAYKSAKEGRYDDRHHAHMAKHYKEAPWWWYIIVLVGSFILGIIVTVKENITLSVWAYVISLLLGCIIAPFSVILYSRYGNGIATNNLSKMLAGLILPGRPVGNMYFAAWSHNVISNAVNLSNDLKMGEYLLGGFVNYAIMNSIVSSNRALLVDGNGNSSWSGATVQSYNTNATSWGSGSLYLQDWHPIRGCACWFVPKIGKFDTSEINLPQFIQYAGYIPYNQSQTCVLFTWITAGFYVQYYLRNYRPRTFRDYSYLITGAFDGASLTVLFILSFAVFGAAGVSHPFPSWWGNNENGNYDWCPVAE